MTNSPPSTGPDIFFAGGECLDRFGVWVRRTDLNLEGATREIHTRASDADAIDRIGILRTWEVDTPRNEWLNEIDLERTRNQLPTTNLTDFLLQNTAEVRVIQPGLFELTDPGGSNAEVLANDVPLISGAQSVTATIWAKHTRVPTATFHYRLSVSGVTIGVFLNPETGEFGTASAGFIAPDAVSVTEINGFWRMEVTGTFTGDFFDYAIFPAWALAGNISGTNEPAAETVIQAQKPQVEFGAAATAFQEIPRDLDRKFASLFLEGSKTNEFSASEDLNDGNYSKQQTTVTTNATIAPDNIATADKLVEDTTVASTHRMSRATPIFVADSNNSVSFYVKNSGRPKFHAFVNVSAGRYSVAVDLLAKTIADNSTGTAVLKTFSLRRLPNDWFRVTFAGKPGAIETTATFFIEMLGDSGGSSYDGDGVSGLFLWGFQYELNQATASSYMFTPTSVQTTRADDVFRAPFPTPPLAMTVYARMIETGTAEVAGARIWHIGDSGGGAPYFRLHTNGGTPGQFSLSHNNGAGEDSSPTTPAGQFPQLGDIVELLAVLAADGSATIIQSLNGGETIQSNGVPVTFAPEWSDELMWINSVGAQSFGFTHSLAIKAHRGVRDLTFMRAL